MSAADIIKRAAMDGVALVVGSDGTVEVSGDQRAVGRWLPQLLALKASVAHLLPEIATKVRDIEAARTWLKTIGDPDAEAVAEAIVRYRPGSEVKAQPNADVKGSTGA